MANDTDERKAKLERFLISALKDDSKISSPRFASLFIEALCICHDDSVILLDKISSQIGLRALQRSVRQDLSPNFINGTASQLLRKLSDPAVATIGDGQVLAQVIKHLLQPSFFWSACVGHIQSDQLDVEAMRGVAWLLSEAMRLMPSEIQPACIDAANDESFVQRILTSTSEHVRGFGYQIKHRAAQLLDGGPASLGDSGPGGRHDNDFKNIKDINIIPTRDEILTKEPSFLRKATEVFDSHDILEHRSVYFDHMFRLLREDMVYDFKEKLQSDGRKKRVPKTFKVTTAFLSAIDVDDDDEKPWQRQPWRVCFTTGKPLPSLPNKTKKSREKFLKDPHDFGPKILRHGSLVTIFTDGRAAGFGYVNRDVPRLAADSAEILLRLEDGCVGLIVDHATNGGHFELVQSDVPVFAYEPFLQRLQNMQFSPLCDMFLDTGLELAIDLSQQSIGMARILQHFESNEDQDWRTVLRLAKDVKLDKSQRAALLSGLSHKVSLIQGPPGTGKSFIGALITRAIYDNLSGTIMVICYTNHALDQFTEDLMDIGIPNAAIVRLGSKSSPRTEGLLLHRQRVKTSLSRSAWCEIKDAEADMISRGENMRGLLQKLSRSVSTDEILSYLEFHDDTEYYDAFEVPIHSNGMSTVGRKGKAIKPDYLLRRWLAGAQDVGPFSKGVFGTSSAVWLMPNDRRRALYNEWEAQIRKQKLDDLQSAGAQYNMRQAEIRNRFKEGDAQLLANKRIIACTSTYAAMSIDILRRVRPETVMLEEAGELLEPHVLTAIHDSTQRIIMIGDHKQLRPKIMNYALSVECGQGFDLNRSLFERLLLRRLPHVTLNQQHRMRPEIAGIVRHLTYPQLEDAPSTRTRPNVRGLQQNVVFVDHREPEDTLEGVTDRNASVSKQNQYEATLALRFVKYLCQQGYTSEDIVVLTPYLGQLRKLRQTLSTENDPVLNDPDSHDLFAAGLLNSAPSASGGPRIRLSSIDNYQGEEKSIVIISLTRSNSTGDIGFMSQPERLNVLLSRARDGLIVIGNISTFTASKKGGELWSSLQKHMAERKWILRGLPIQCQSHPDVKNIAVKPDDFATMCPDGGCSQLCQEMLSCKTHKCPSRCHILVDHSKIRCPEVIKHTCPKGHSTSYLCQTKPPSDCITCKTLDEKRQRRAKNQLEKFKMQEAEQRRHDQEMEALDEEIALMRKEMANMSLKQEQSIALAAKLQDREAVQKRLEIAKKRAMNATATAPRNGQQSSNVKGTPGFSGTKNEHQSSKQQQQASDQESAEVSPSREEWLRQKRVEGQKNDALDQLVDMVGLENVKQYILDTKGQIEVKKRQNVLSGGERYHASFLGNPGTGKTTVARLWAKLLYTLEVLPGDVFEETTGSKLATGGIQSMQKHIATIVAGNGGVMFIDEAYQLTSGTSAGGRQVLDFLLAEIENQRDKVVFIFAGYRQQMETFYSHNPGIPSRIPHRLDFCDYSEAELLLMLQKLFKKRFNDNAKIEDGNKGLFMRIAARRLSRRRGQEGFGNMRDLENLFGGICARQASRISRERRQGSIPDDFVFEKEDLIGPEPSSALLQSAAWKKLHSLIGLATVKQSISSLVAVLKTNYHRELEEKEPIQVSLNKVFLGPPGTGKTSVAKLYGRLLADIGLLTKGDVLEKTPTDFIGAALGASEQATSGILESAKGKVLIIDEAYMLNPTQSSGQTATDPYRSAVIDTIVSKVHNVPGDDQCVILLGYEEEMEAMFQNSNPGFTRRFPLASAFRFDSFTPDELHQILRLKLAEEDLTVTEQGEHTAMDVLSRARNLSNFGNAGEVSNVIGKAKLSWQKRMTDAVDMVQDLDSIDFDPDFARADTASIRLQNLFQDSIGHHHLVDQLRQYQLIAANLKAKGLPVEDHVPFNFIFKGPPGTGKTTTARKIGQVYYDMGLLDKVEVVECSVSDLVAEYVGQTGPKTRKQLERGLGKVLLVDEAYRLSEGHFATEAVNELTDLLTKPKFKGKVITVLAGYENEMNTMLAVNPGLASRFSETIHFTSLSPQQCVELFTSRLRSHGLSCRELDDSQSSGHQEISEVFEDLTKLKHWGNGRDIGNLSSKAMRFALGREIKEGEDAYELPCSYVLDVLKRELLARQKMEGTTCSTNAFDGTTSPEAYQQITNSASPPSTMTVQQIVTEQEPEPDELAEETTESSRDAGVSDATWNQLQADIAAATQRQLSDSRALQTLAAEVTDCHNTLEQASLELAQREQAIEEHPSSGDGGDGGDSDSEEAKAAAEKRRQLLKQLERARLRKAEMARQRALAEEKAAREKERQAQEREKEAVAQKKLKRTGVCPVGYQWIRQSNGYICAGGAHFVSHAQLDSIS